MASVSTEARGGKRSLDAEINLVPFIDLLSMCICFLLMTAVWMEIGALQIKQSHGTEATAAPQQSYEIDARFAGPTSIAVSVKKQGKVVDRIDVKAATPEAMASELSQRLASWQSSKAHGIPVSSAMLTPAGGVSYGQMVGVIDAFRKNQIVNLGIVPVK